MTARKVLLGLCWLLGAVAIAGLTWAAVDSAGREVVAGPPMLDLPTPTVVTTEPSRSSPVATTSPGATTTTSTTTTARVTRTRRVPRTSPPRTTARTGTRSGTSTTSTSSSMTTTTTTTTTTRQSRTASRVTDGGTLTLTCSGAEIVDWSARPDDGWSVRRRSADSTRVRVEFERRWREIEVSGACDDGVPVFEVEDDH